MNQCKPHITHKSIMTQFCIHYFKEYQETCKNLVPVERVVYDILSNVQKKFSRDLLKVIFSKTHLKAYPDLKETLKHFFLNGNYSSHLLQGRKDNFILFFFFFQDRVSLYSPSCPGTHFVHQAGLELRNPPASASQVQELKACVTTAQLHSLS